MVAKILELDNLNKFVSQNGNRYDFILRIPGVLKVIYLNAIPSGNDLTFKGIEKEETSYVMVHKNPFVFYSNGTFKDKREITTSGYWTIKRISEKLPTNYLTSHKNSKTTN